MDNQSAPTPIPQAILSSSVGARKRKIILISSAALALFFISAAVYFSPFKLRLPTYAPTPPAEGVIAKVGEELIYRQDLDTELANYPAEAKVDKNKTLLNKIVQDSIILQAAGVEGLVALDQSIYNSPNKDYLKRVKTVQQAQKTVEEKTDSISGTVFSIWFYNVKPASIGYEKGKEVAFSKISKVQAAVKNKQLSTKQAAEEIRNDTTLLGVDLQYKTNAAFDFQNVTREKKITFDPKFDAKLWELAPGGVSDVYPAQLTAPDTGEKIDLVYIFGVIDKKINTGKIASFNEWLSQKEKGYEITYY